ncbi:hypothetical protein [Mucilaginibacter sp. KACC 22063]|uniref:hypothetical protein n=1 Tax=Mucilaginibacter sp. KACC 22063 TaxID=3025666 RepID=UPI002365C1FB|nr:hypothetical protein [Mucilaginibacter sp. KACC 22063]WDF55901.1 hypothetical protein PQ461_02350 [Mucilaginibacter sp. KACC 22063]
MTLISFQHSIKYIYLQLAPYVALTIFAGFMASGLNFLWYMALLALSALLSWRLFTLTAIQYFFTHDMLVISRGVIFKTVDSRPLWQLKGLEIRHSRLLTMFHISHIEFGLEGPPSDRIRIIGVDDEIMLKVFEQLNEGIELNIETWRNYFQQAKD